MIRIIQADNRPNFDILNLTREINQRACLVNGWQYEFHVISGKHTLGGKLHPATAKIPFLKDVLDEACDGDIIVFLDSDAWVHNGALLAKIIDKLVGCKDKQGCFSRDPYYDHNTFVNSGSFVLRVSEYTRQMYDRITKECVNVPWDYVNVSLKIPKDKFHTKECWPYDQHYVSKFVYDNLPDFIVFDEYVMNTPLGMALRHNWLKAEKLYRDVKKKLDGVKESVDVSRLDVDAALDTMPFPNTRKEEPYWPYFYSDEYENTVHRKFKLVRIL